MIIYRQPFKGEYPITQQYGEIVPGVTYKEQPHSGIDYGCPVNTEVYASADGTVMYAEYDNFGYGYCVMIEHPDGKGTVYAHLAKIKTKVHTKVKQGDVIGLSGMTGNVTGPHLHFEARSKWYDYKSHEDPISFLPMMTIDDSTGKPKPSILKEPAVLGSDVEIVAPSGAWGWNKDFSLRTTVFPVGTKLHYTGHTTERNGYTYCEVYPEPVKYWVAMHDNVTQILDNEKQETNDETI